MDSVCSLGRTPLKKLSDVVLNSGCQGIAQKTGGHTKRHTTVIFSSMGCQTFFSWLWFALGYRRLTRASESASISGSAEVKTIGGWHLLFSVFCPIRHGLGGVAGCGGISVASGKMVHRLRYWEANQKKLFLRWGKPRRLWCVSLTGREGWCVGFLYRNHHYPSQEECLGWSQFWQGVLGVL